MALVRPAPAAEIAAPTVVGLPALLAVLEDGGPSERRAAACALSQHPTAAEQLGDALGREPELSVRVAILDALVKIAGADAARALSTHLGSDDVALRNGAIEALQSVGEAGGDEMAALLHDPDPDKRIYAVNVLEAVRDTRAVAWLREALGLDQDVNVGLAIVEALCVVGGPEDVQAMRDFAARHSDVAFVDFAVGVACRRVSAS